MFLFVVVSGLSVSAFWLMLLFWISIFVDNKKQKENVLKHAPSNPSRRLHLDTFSLLVLVIIASTSKKITRFASRGFQHIS